MSSRPSAARELAPGLWRLELPSRTLPPWKTTNTYLIADAGVGAVVDPGFEDESSLRALEEAVQAAGVGFVKAVLLTHSHRDHRAGADAVVSAFGVPALYVHPLEMGRVGSPVATGLTDGRALMVGDTIVRALHTPGHSPGHLSFHLEERGALLAGDLVAGEGSVWVGVPEGDVGDYVASLESMSSLPGLALLAPGHGEPSREPLALLSRSRAHRLERELQVLAALERPRGLGELLDAVYGPLPEGLRQPARATLLAHLRKLMHEMRVVHLGGDEEGPFAARR